MRNFLTGINLAKSELQNAVMHPVTVDPVSPVAGQMWYRSDLQALYLRLASTTVALATGLTTEDIQDIVGAMFSGNTESGITVTYDDTDGTVDFTVTDSPLLGGQTLAQVRARSSHTGTQDAATTLTQATARILGRVTAAAGATEELTAAQVKTLLAIVAADVSDFNTAVRTSRLDQMAAPTASVAMNAQKITGLQDGTATTDAATVGQMTAVLESKTWKDPVVAASTGNLTLSAPQTVDGIALTAGMRVLVKDQSTTAQNGIYVVAAGAWTRAADMSSAAEFNNATVLIQQGTVNKGDTYTQTATVVTVDTSAVTWTKTGEGNTSYGADGTTLTLTGTTFGITNGGVGATQLAAAVAGNGLAGGAGTALSVNVANGIEIASDAVQIAASAAGAGLTGGGGSALAVGAGTGISVAADSVAVDTAVVVRKYATALVGGATSEVITHNLNTRDVSVVVRNNLTPWEEVEVDVEATTVNTVTLRATGNLPASYRVLVLG